MQPLSEGATKASQIFTQLPAAQREPISSLPRPCKQVHTKKGDPLKVENNIVTRDWAATTILLAGGVSGCSDCLPRVIGLNIIQVIHYIYREQSLTALPVQVRTSHLSLLFLAQAPYLFWIFWWQLIGTAAMVLFQYCFLARCLSLMPWNRHEPWSMDLVKRTSSRPRSVAISCGDCRPNPLH